MVRGIALLDLRPVAGGDDTTGITCELPCCWRGVNRTAQEVREMSHQFRFGAGSASTSSAAEFTENARRIEGQGYNICLVADHFEEPWLAAGPALASANPEPGITLPPPRVRVEQLHETLAVVKGLWSNGTLSFSGEHYTITEMEGWPKPFSSLAHPYRWAGAAKACSPSPRSRQTSSGPRTECTI
jgi:alkanesulfonate monooxygenase SsuD/methylene tetrahydromethanopterin reductase-like flavin-dependent oxidoreductase (luciferase family)